MPVKRGPKKEEHPLIVMTLHLLRHKDGLPIVHYTNITGENDITMIISTIVFYKQLRPQAPF